MQYRFELTMRSILSTVTCQPKAERQMPLPQLSLAIAYSGGLDSTVLLHLCANFAKLHQIPLFAFHVHHGISSNADQWVAHCQHQCAELGLPFDAVNIQLGNTNGQGIEATARKKRYAALGELCRQRHVDVILTGHHQDDQAETMLLQLLRGTGIAGLRGMQQLHHAAELLNNPTLFLARPLLDYTRTELEDYATQHKVSHIEDESNADIRYTRNALRHQIMPLLAHHFPSYQARFSRTARHAESALQLLEQLAKQDYEHCLVQSHLDVLQLQQLPQTRIDNVLRYWFTAHQLQMPGTARLTEMRKQLLYARDDAQVSVKHGEFEVHRYRQRLSITICAKPLPNEQNFVWKGEASLAFPTFFGTLYFDSATSGQTGVDRAWLLKQQLQLRPRQGGERLKLAINRPTRSIKSHYQTNGIPYWQRERLPFIFVGKDLLFAANVGVNGDFQVSDIERVALRWQSDESMMPDK